MSRRSDPQGRQPAQVSLLGNLSLAWRYVWNESLKQKKNFFIGFTAVWLVVFSIAYVDVVGEFWPPWTTLPGFLIFS